MTVCDECGMTPDDPEAHKRDVHDRIRDLMSKQRRPTHLRPVSSEERREREEGTDGLR